MLPESHRALGYGVCVALAFLLAFLVKRSEERRLRYARRPGYVWVGVGALLGAVVGSKLGMLLYLDADAWLGMVGDLASFRMEGKTVLGGLAGGYVGVELVKRLVGMTASTGDAFAVAIPLGQAIGRFGCFLGGCCYGAPSHLPWAVEVDGVARHPAPLYEAGLDLTLAALLFGARRVSFPEGHRFRAFLVGYAVIRFALDPLRGDPVVRLLGLSLPQWLCLFVAVGFGITLARDPRVASADGS